MASSKDRPGRGGRGKPGGPVKSPSKPGPGREPNLAELAALERGAARRDPGGRLSVALVWPGSYHTGQSSLGFLWVYRFLSRRADALAERFFALTPPAGRPVSLESGRALADFDLIAASMVLENDYWLLLDILSRAGLDPLRENRAGSGPLVLAGGVGVWGNPWPLMPYVDVFLTGEGEAQWPRLADLFVSRDFLGLDRRGRLEALAGEVPGVLAPELWPGEVFSEERPFDPDDAAGFEPVRPAALGWPFPAGLIPPSSPILTPATEFPETTLVEISRGCPWGCRFCLAGALYRPHRPWPLAGVLEAAASMVPTGGRVGLVSPAVADHPELGDIFDALAERGASVGVSSLRLSSLTEGLVGRLSRAGLRALAVAPEAGTQTLRERINKNLTAGETVGAASLLAGLGLRRLKLYFMTGFDSETEDDLRGLAGLVFEVMRAVRRRGGGPLVSVSLANFTPKPHTPLEGTPLLTESQMRERGRLAASFFSGRGGVELRLDPPRWTLVQGLLARGGPGSHRLVAAQHRHGGRAGPALREYGYDPAASPVHRPWSGPRPWRVVAPSAGLEFLAREARRSEEGRPTPPCPAERSCGRCGACDGLAGPGK
ncbi:MAG: radical SAM protein [Deltaproteobacteria bacterium]|nr:radical SAM protein [Deltaproteobacteria bacterium]